MNVNITEFEQIKVHVERRNKILHELQEIYTKYLSPPANDIGSSLCNLPDAIRESYSPIVEDLLREMNETKLRKFNENDANDCYRCKHFLNIPQNLIKAHEELSDCTEEYEADLIFVQAVVWLKSATMFMKDISIEQFHLIFHKQWNLMEINRNRRNTTRKDFENFNSHTIPKFLLEELHCEFLDSPKPLDASKRSFDSDPEYANSIDLASNITWNRSTDLCHCHRQRDAKQNDKDFIKGCSDLSIFVSRTSEIHVRSFTDKSTTSDKSIIPESDTEYSSCSDIFKDSLQDEEITNVTQNKNDEDSVIATRGTDPSRISSKLEDDSDVTMFDKDCSLYPQNNESKLSSESHSQSIIQCTKESDYHSRKKNFLVPPKQVNKVINNSSLLKDSAYETYPLSGVHSIIKNDDTVVLSNGKIDDTVICQRENSAMNFDCFTMPNEDCMSGRNQQSWLSSLKLSLDQENDERADSFRIEPSQRNVERDSQNCEDLIEDMELTGPHGKRIKLEWVDKTDCMVKKNTEKRERMIHNRRENSAMTFDCFTMPNEDCMSGRNHQSWLSSLKLSLDQENDERADSFRIEPSQRNVERGSQNCKDLVEDMELTEPHVKMIKLEWVDKPDCMVKKNIEKKERMISSKWLRFTLDALSIDEVAFQSVKVILSILQDERIARQYAKKRFWSNTLESEAVNAIVNFCDVFEAEKRSNACTQEIVQTVTDTLEKIIGNSELNQVTILTHQTSIILELCTSMKVCIEVINYLTAKLKSQEGILVSLMNSKKADVYTIVNRLHITFYALTFCLQKYRTVFRNKDENQFDEETIPPVVDLWKKQLLFANAIIEDNAQKREQRWLTILNDFTVIAANDFPQFTENSRRLIGILTCK